MLSVRLKWKTAKSGIGIWKNVLYFLVSKSSTHAYSLRLWPISHAWALFKYDARGQPSSGLASLNNFLILSNAPGNYLKEKKTAFLESPVRSSPLATTKYIIADQL